jgi:hypothetical protein
VCHIHIYISVNINFIIIIIVIIGSTVVVRASATSHRRFRNLIKILGRTPLDE